MQTSSTNAGGTAMSAERDYFEGSAPPPARVPAAMAARASYHCRAERDLAASRCAGAAHAVGERGRWVGRSARKPLRNHGLQDGAP
jgi:hypothetical protein